MQDSVSCGRFSHITVHVNINTASVFTTRADTRLCIVKYRVSLGRSGHCLSSDFLNHSWLEGAPSWGFTVGDGFGWKIRTLWGAWGEMRCMLELRIESQMCKDYHLSLIRAKSFLLGTATPIDLLRNFRLQGRAIWRFGTKPRLRRGYRTRGWHAWWSAWAEYNMINYFT